MKWASAISQNPELTEALAQTVKTISDGLGAEPPSLVVAFVSVGYDADLGSVPAILRTNFPDAVIVGCCGAGVIGDGKEVEDRLAVALTAGYLPDVCITPFRVPDEGFPSPDDPPGAWTDMIGVSEEVNPDFLVFMDSFSPPGQALLAGMDFAYPSAIKVGGISSGGTGPNSLVLYLDGEVFRSGAVGVALSGNIKIDTVVAQGCRPLGEAKHVTRCHQNVLLEFGGKPPLHYLNELYSGLSEEDRALVNGNLFLGIAIDPIVALDQGSPGEFLIRNLIGADQQRGILAVGEILHEGQLVQFHVRDSTTSADDLAQQLQRYLAGSSGHSGQAALMFQCNGRGTYLYGRPNFDADLFESSVGKIPLGGFFCNGEIGPVGGSTYLHSYTSSIVIFRQPE